MRRRDQGVARSRQAAADGRILTDGGRDGDDRASIGDVVGGSREAFQEESEEFVDVWGEQYSLDYTPESFSRLDEIMASQQERANYLEVSLESGESVTFAPIATGAACYVGETLVRTHDAEWTRSEGRWGIDVDGPDATVFVNVFHIAHDCLQETPKFEAIYGTVCREAGLE